MMASTNLRVTAFPVIPEFFARQVSFSFVLARTWNLYDLDIGECSSVPCQNNGTCVDEINRFSCNCTSAFTGALCETSRIVNQSSFFFQFFYLDVDECESGPCQNNGTCFDGVGTFTCQCVTGYTGDQCETSEGVFG